MTPIFVLTNNKGGVGKSTSVVNIAYGLTLALQEVNAPNQKVLVVETDGQGHSTLLTTRSRPGDFGKENSLYEVLVAGRQDAAANLNEVIVQSAWHENLHIAPGNEFLDQAEQQLVGVTGAPYRLTDALNRIAPHYAAVFIDTRPSFSLMTEMALVAGTDVLIPLEAKFLETVGLQRIITKVNEVKEGWRVPNLKVSGIFITKLDKRSKGQLDMLAQLQSHPTLGRLIIGVVPQNEAVTYAHSEMLSVFEYDAGCAASVAYGELVKAVFKMMYARSNAS